MLLLDGCRCMSPTGETLEKYLNGVAGVGAL